MKRAWIVLFIFTVLLSGCTSNVILYQEDRQESIVEFCNQKEITDFANSFFQNRPVALSYYCNLQEADEIAATVTNPEFITAVYEALMDVTVGDKYTGDISDSGEKGYLFTMEDGRQIYFIFWKNYLALERDNKIQYYEISNAENLFDLTFSHQ
ncbi:MAG: hypothetical protein RR364_03280 [Lachnospiraceae bacterium]